jgi:hypothetical protein
VAAKRYQLKKQIMSDKKSSPKELNLGLTELLARAIADGAAQALPGETTPKLETAIVTLEDDIQTLNSELSRLAESGEWGMLVGRAESAIASEEDIEARLWWIRGHLGAFTLPVSLLAAPFETVCRQLVGDSRVEIFADLIREIGEIALVRLHDVGDRRQEYAVRLALCKLGILDATEMSGKGYGRNPPKVPRFELGTVSVEQPAATAVVQRPGRNKTVRVAGVLLALLCSLVTGVFLLREGSPIHQPLLTAPEDLLVMNEVPGMMPPGVVGRPVSSSLGALYYSLDKDAGDVSKVAAQTVAAGAQEKKGERKGGLRHVATEQVREQVAARASQSERPPAPEDRKPREVVRTDGPIEGPDFARGIERQQVPQPRLPEVIPPAEPKPLPNLSYPDGSINVGGEIKSTLVRTDVFDSPSYQARPIARLEPGDKVSVEGRVGQWLRIRSRRGRAGFVYAQDIGELEEFNVDSSPQ